MTNIEFAAQSGADKLGATVSAHDREAAAQGARVFIGAVIVFAFAIALFIGGASLLKDPDTLWHITLGKDIWATKSFPDVDGYSHTFAGEPWIAKEWLSQLTLYAAYAAGGWSGVVFLTVTVIAIVIAQVYGAVSSAVKPTIAAAVTIACVALSSNVFLARPHIIVLPVIILFTHQLWESARLKKAPSFWLLAAMCVWSNMHASFTFGFAVAFFAFVYYIYQSRDLTSERTRLWVLFLALCPVASMAHPYGYQSIWSTVTIVESEALPYISEWLPFSAENSPVVAFVFLALVAGMMVSRFRTNIVVALFVCLLLHLFFTHGRFVYLLFLLAPLVLMHDVASSFPAVSFKRFTESLADNGFERTLARTARYACIALAAAFVAGAGLVSSRMEFGPTSLSYPVAAIDAARDHGVSGNVLNEYNFGGALIFEGVETFIDGRADRLFQNGFFPEIKESAELGGEEMLHEHLERYGIGWSILKPTDGRVVFLDEAGWTRVYEDEFAVVQARPRNP